MDAKKLHDEAGELFRRAVELEPAEREQWLLAEASDRPEVLREALSLLAHHLTDSFLERGHSASSRGDPPPTSVPTAVGPYRVHELLGWGGAGVVYLATQPRPYRLVALKVLRADVAVRDALLRFRRESEILALLDHPGIPRVVESGEIETPAGKQSFIAMEYVEGTPLLEHAKELEHAERVRLGAKLARIVEHAHQRGIVHRDLKPANILVREDGQPVVLDFGIARQLEESTGELSDWTRFEGETVTGQLLGTLAYMSPEQAAGHVEAIDARTDVYALGVIVYELVSGKLPYETRDKLITEAIRMIERDDPTPLSHYGKSFRGDLETIVEQAMRKEPARRYGHAGELAEDLERFLERRSIRARPPSALYLVQRFLSRHRRASALALGSILLLLTALFSSLTSLRAANRAEHELRNEHAVTMRFADELLLDRLLDEVDRLWPARPEELARFEDWLQRAELLVTNRAVHARHLADAELLPGGADELERLHLLVERIDRFVGPGGPLEQARERYRCARELEARTIGDHADDWEAARRAIADVARSPHYRGLELSPQVGLVPLGPDPDSGLWEFGCYGVTGELAERDPKTGRLSIEESTGLVFVLIPGGEFLFGAQATDPDGPNFDPRARDHEGPPERIELDAFFLSKYEWTQAQWQRLTGGNPSYYAVGDHVDNYRFTALSPVESVSWTECMEALGRLRLSLPTEAQWEYAARAGSSSIYWSGDDPDGVILGSNLREKPVGDEREAIRMHCPVGSLAANAFGLHDMTGNVSEWCLDVFKVDCRRWPVREGDGLRLTPDGPERVRRGGSWASSTTVARSARRDDQLHYLGSAIIGLRAARAVDR